MKFRSDFVTNSSSSSYVIAYRKTPQIDEETLKRYPFMKAYQKVIDSIISCDGGETDEADVINTKEEYDKYFVDRYGWRNDTIEDIIKEDSYLKGMYEKVTEYFEKGYAIFCKNIDHNDEGLESLIDAIAKGNEDFVILESD